MEPRDEGLDGVMCDYETPEGPCERGWGHNGDHDAFYVIRNPAGDTLPSSEVVIARLTGALTVASEMENDARESLYQLREAAERVVGRFLDTPASLAGVHVAALNALRAALATPEATAKPDLTNLNVYIGPEITPIPKAKR